MASNIDFTKKLLDLDGKVINGLKQWALGDAKGNPILKDGKPQILQDQGDPLTLAAVASECLIVPNEGAEAKTNLLQRFELALRIRKAKGAIKLEAEEIVLVETAIITHNKNPLIVGRACEILNK